MKWTIEYVPEHDYVKVKTRGLFDVAHQTAMLQEILDSSFWHPGIKYFFDHRGINFSNKPYKTIKEASEAQIKFASQLTGAKVALLMKSELHFGKAHQFEFMVEEKIPIDIAVFLDKKEALEWLISR